MVRWDEDLYNAPAYPVTDAARYLRIPTPTLQAWLKGRTYPTKRGRQLLRPLIQRPNPELPQLSFNNLVEAHVLRIIRETHQIKLDKVRQALDYMGEQFDTAHPLVIKRFQTDGVDLFIEQITEDSKKTLVNVSRGGQFALREVLKHLLTRVEWNPDGIASRFFPITDWVIDPQRDKIIVIDPSIRFGRPVIAGKGVPTDAIVDLYNAGDTINDIADEFDCTPEQVKQAIRFDSLLLAA